MLNQTPSTYLVIINADRIILAVYGSALRSQADAFIKEYAPFVRLVEVTTTTRPRVKDALPA